MRRVVSLVVLAMATVLAQRQPTSDFLVNNLLAAHNAVRSRVGVKPLVWSEELADFAQQWADNLAARGQLFHRRHPPYGENLYEMTGGGASPEQVVNDWASESKDYQYKSNTCRRVCGHYTQIVWRDTKRVGCAVARSGRTEIWVCNYDPPGNRIGKRPY